MIQHFYFYSFLTYNEHIRKCSKLQIMIVFPVLIPVQNFLFPGTGRENLKCHGKGRIGKFEACIPGNHGKREFPLTPGFSRSLLRLGGPPQATTFFLDTLSDTAINTRSATIFCDAFIIVYR